MVISITQEDFDVNAMIQSRKAQEVGGLVSFVGIVRDDGITKIELEAFEEAALEELNLIKDEAFEKYPLMSVDIIHRIGMLNVGDNLLLILVAAGHRKEAFDGCEYILERIKETVQIWKKEFTEDGERWVPGEHH